MNVLKVVGCSMALCALPLLGQTGGGTELFRDMKAPQHERIMDLLSRLTVEEKISLLVNDAPAIGRLGIDKYNHAMKLCMESCGLGISRCFRRP